MEPKVFPAKVEDGAATGQQVESIRKAVHITMLTDITRDCDCLNRDQKKAVPDIGIIASADIVALEQATLDITAKLMDRTSPKNSVPGWIRLFRSNTLRRWDWERENTSWWRYDLN